MKWFSVEAIDSGTYAISEYEHWEEAHAYLLCGGERALLVDTGLGVADIKAVVDRLTDLPLLVTSTHVHWDHIGGHGSFEHHAVHVLEEAWLSGGFPLPLEIVKKNLTRYPCRFPSDFDPSRYQIYRGGAARILQDGTILDLGGRAIKVIHTPGHSPGHCCFYDVGRGYLLTGDLIYCGCLDAYYQGCDPVLFGQSIRRVGALEITKLLPGHHTLDIPVTLVRDIEEGFATMAAATKLKRGSGLFEFDGFEIHI